MTRIEKQIDVFKVDKGSRLVYGWAIICTKNGEPYIDLQGDHIPVDVMIEAAADFMANSRVAKVQHEGEQVGHVLFAMPVDVDVAKAAGFSTDVEGLLIATRWDSDSVLDAFDSSELTGYSIGGVIADAEEVEIG